MFETKQNGGVHLLVLSLNQLKEKKTAWNLKNLLPVFHYDIKRFDHQSKYRYPPLAKIHVMLLYFYERPTLASVFTNQKKYKEDFHLVIASFTLSLSAYEKFYRNALHSISGGNVFILWYHRSVQLRSPSHCLPFFSSSLKKITWVFF